MIGVRKPFSKNLHAKNDPKTRTLVKKFFADRGITLVDHPNEFDIDLVSEDGQIRIEVEHRFNWSEVDFPFNTVNILERKAKFFREGNTHYCILSANYKRLGFISANKIQQFIKPEFLVESPNKYVKKGEYVFKVPIGQFEFYDL